MTSNSFPREHSLVFCVGSALRKCLALRRIFEGTLFQISKHQIHISFSEPWKAIDGHKLLLYTQLLDYCKKSHIPKNKPNLTLLVKLLKEPTRTYLLGRNKHPILCKFQCLPIFMILLGFDIAFRCKFSNS